MASVFELLLNSLKDLGKDELKAFQWHLKKNHKEISHSEMEEADRFKTVDIMVDVFGEEEAVKNTVEILRKMNKNNQAKNLEKNLKQETERSTSPSPHGTSSLTNVPHSLQLTLDPNTAYKHLCLSDNNREVSYTKKVQYYSNHADRFDYYHQVLCRENVSGHCYWEIEWSGDGVYVSVSYNSISRKGVEDECAFGHNDKSWSLYCSPDKYTFIHNNIWNDLPVKPMGCRKIRVNVDYSAGTLSFYRVSDTMSLIHTIQTTFTQLLYPGFYLDFKSSVKLC
ncbi:stonustoxin subunit beta-like [Sinocyclocheilus rhinocerous]|uniref:stonustoxin subunit beta-like n=1 Tax=Sinocyclocheilus rhinocerous TaxID=307959 RepID=UPI0007B7A38B|nr:PREDICTED: stonustoxin subunit beta-like [Sinocyclocheilus rhinocerous]